MGHYLSEMDPWWQRHYEDLAGKPEGMAPATVGPQETKVVADIGEIEWISAALIDKVDERNQAAVRKLHHEHWNIISMAPGSTHNHQSWPGGYLEHIRQVNHYVATIFSLWEQMGVMSSLGVEESFTLPEALTIATLHDIEKPFRTQYGSDGSIRIDERLQTKSDRDQFKESLLTGYDIDLDANQRNAMEYVEGMRDSDYTPGRRVMTPMAVLCHTADMLSARGSYNLGNPGRSHSLL